MIVLFLIHVDPPEVCKKLLTTNQSITVCIHCLTKSVSSPCVSCCLYSYYLKDNPHPLVHNQCWHIMTILIIFLPHQVKHLDHQHQAEQTVVHPYRLSHVLHLFFGYVAVPIGVIEPEGPPEPVLLSAPQQQGEGHHKFLWGMWGKVWNVRILTWNVMTPAPVPSSRENR